MIVPVAAGLIIHPNSAPGIPQDVLILPMHTKPTINASFLPNAQDMPIPSAEIASALVSGPAPLLSTTATLAPKYASRYVLKILITMATTQLNFALIPAVEPWLEILNTSEDASTLGIAQELP